MHNRTKRRLLMELSEAIARGVQMMDANFNIEAYQELLHDEILSSNGLDYPTAFLDFVDILTELDTLQDRFAEMGDAIGAVKEDDAPEVQSKVIQTRLVANKDETRKRLVNKNGTFVWE